MHRIHSRVAAPFTEDMLVSQESELTRLGDHSSASSVGLRGGSAARDAIQLRAKLQSLSLKSDMEAFKAANPGCAFADFVRWHSPRDWVPSDDGAHTLSERMTQGGGGAVIASAFMCCRRQPLAGAVARCGRRAGVPPARALRQHHRGSPNTALQCADPHKAERVLAYFESVAPHELMWQLFPLLLVCLLRCVSGTHRPQSRVHECLARHATAKYGPVAERLRALLFAASNFGRERMEDLERLQVTRTNASGCRLTQRRRTWWTPLRMQSI